MNERALEISQTLLSKARSALEKRFWQDKLMDKLMAACMADDNLRTQLFRFVDVFPVLKTNKDITYHFMSYVSPYKNSFPWIIRKALWFIDKPITTYLAGLVISWSIRLFAKHFIIDSADQKKVESVGHNLRKQGYDITWDILGEDVLSQDEALAFRKKYLDLIERPDTNNVSIKFSSLVPKTQWDAIDFDGCVNTVSELFAELLRAGKKYGATINVDMEQYAIRDLTLAIFKKALIKTEFRNLPVGIVFQSYLADSEKSLDDLLAWIYVFNQPVTIRLVKGAYWDCEIINAKQQNWPVPVLTDKSATDTQFERMAEKILRAQRLGTPVNLACASHNLHSIAYVMNEIEMWSLDKKRNEFQVLYGMGDPIRGAILEAGYPVRIYTPYGKLIPGMGYLVRRLLENTSQQSFLGLHFVKKTQNKEVQTLPDPKDPAKQPQERLLMPKDYQPESPTDFSRIKNRIAMLNALDSVDKERGVMHPLLIGEEKIYGQQGWLCSENPANHGTKNMIGGIAKAGIPEAKLAMQAAKNAFPHWSAIPVRERADILLKAARIIRERRFKLAALQIYETSKTWREADADVAEAIDFLEYYAKMAVELMRYRPTEKLSGESNNYGYEGRGVIVVISPWNFPMAIATGMCSAALAAGNTVVFKPASATPIIGYKIVEILLEAGLPPGALNLIAGSGGELGEFLVKHPDTVNVLFTGSKKVGFKLIRWAGEANDEQQTHCRRVIAEMGGKNAIIVDSSADLDQAVDGVVKSAFSFQGQKCSACSRVIVLDSIYPEFLERLKGAADALKIGDPRRAETELGAVIDENAFKEIHRYIKIGKKEAKLAYQKDLSKIASRGWFIGPTIFSNVSPTAIIAQEEIFGPVLAIIKAESFEKAIQIANDSKYHLTGGIYSRTDEHIALTKKHFRVGNLYINRTITGSIVGRQPFGGFGASGTGPKAGSPDYLLPLIEARTITECLTRRGFSPELKN